MKYTTLIAVCLFIFGCNPVKTKATKTDINFVDTPMRGLQVFSVSGKEYFRYFDTLGNYISIKIGGETLIKGDTVSIIKSLLKFSAEYMKRQTVMISDRGDTTRWSVYDTIRLITCKSQQ